MIRRSVEMGHFVIGAVDLQSFLLFTTALLGIWLVTTTQLSFEKENKYPFPRLLLRFRPRETNLWETTTIAKQTSYSNRTVHVCCSSD